MRSSVPTLGGSDPVEGDRFRRASEGPCRAHPRTEVQVRELEGWVPGRAFRCSRLELLSQPCGATVDQLDDAAEHRARADALGDLRSGDTDALGDAQHAPTDRGGAEAGLSSEPLDMAATDVVGSL